MMQVQGSSGSPLYSTPQLVVQGTHTHARTHTHTHTLPTHTHITQMSCWWFLTFTGSAVKEKIQYLTGVRYLYDSINPDQIEIPNFILEHDIQVRS